MSRNIKLLMDEGRPQKQAVAIAYKKAREGGCRLTDTRGGGGSRPPAKRASAKRSSRRSTRGMSFGSGALAQKVAHYAQVFGWKEPFAKSIVAIHESPHKDMIGTVSAAVSGGRTVYKVRSFDVNARREDLDVSFQTQNLSEANGQAKAYAWASRYDIMPGHSKGRSRRKPSTRMSTASKRRRRGMLGMAVGFEWPPLDPEYWRRKKNIDLPKAVARAKEKTARKAAEEKARQEERELMATYKAFTESSQATRLAREQAQKAGRYLRVPEVSESAPETQRKIRSDDIPPTLRQVPETQRMVASRSGAAFGKTRTVVFEYDDDRYGRVVNVNAAGEVLVGKTVGGKRKKVGKIKRKKGHNYFGKQGRVYEVRARLTGRR